ncbi:MAG: radical SAM protein [delta proteobacterium ML8_D]|jgi:putative pyruvate formate lyase activating enzyme|nr:MAG: radical SAM protein [delta proteobacterium ML8_D]
MCSYKPGYLELFENGELERRVDKAWESLTCCNMCPHLCRVDRLEGEQGFCGATDQAVVASYGPHFGEETPLVGRKGSGAVFFSWCNLRCLYCQNYEISHLGAGRAVSTELLASCFLSLQKDGCHNINLVTPSHMVPFILKALLQAAKGGLSIPLVYNTGGYDSIRTLRLLDGIVDIYMPDFKYWDKDVGEHLSNIANYPQVAKKAVKEMHRQVGELILGPDGVAQRGLLIRHLVLPGGLSDTGSVLKYIAEEISPNTYVNLMDQYRPCGMAHKYPPLDRRISPDEFAEALRAARDVGLNRLDKSK